MSEELMGKFTEFKKKYNLLRDTVMQVFIGNEEIVKDTIISFLAGGHVLLEGVPGLGKTLLVKTLSGAMDLQFSRIQFTPDIMPPDILGTNILVEDERGKRHFSFQRGPLFANIILADEINRATPKTQSALLEVMQEHHITIAGERYKMDEPFFVLATQNPIEMEGTYPLPEAQLDRFFFKLKVSYPSFQDMKRILDLTEKESFSVSQVLTHKDISELRQLPKNILISDDLKTYIIRLVIATHPHSESDSQLVKKYVRFGSSPRGAQALIKAAKIQALINGRYSVSLEDITAVVYPALRHRILLNFSGEAEHIDTDTIVADVLKKVW
jgi:MoxR-like ATPase